MLTYSLENRGEASLYAFLYFCIRSDIESGAIRANEKLPSKRTFAKHLGVSLITVEGAYAQLVAEGYLYTQERKGYFASSLAAMRPAQQQQTAPVNPGTPQNSGAPVNAETPHNPNVPVNSRSLYKPSSPSNSRAPQNSGAPVNPGTPHNPNASVNFCCSSAEISKEIVVANFTGSSPAHGLFPYHAWARALRESLAQESEESLLGESGAAGSRRLREALARYLQGFRGMKVDASQIVVGAGAQILYLMIVQLLGRQHHFAVEDPGYPRLTKIYQANDVQLSPIPLDAAGVSVSALQASNASVLHCMPSHQFPTGLVTSISRRYELLGWANQKPNRYLLEDDYDCEFRFAGLPIPSLQSIDVDERVIYANTFTKSLGPAFRLGYLVLPPHLAALFEEKLGFYSCTVSAIDQLALARFLESGGYERHVNRLRNRYRTVRNALIEALQASSVSNFLTIEEEDSGLHFVLSVRSSAREEQLVEALRGEGVLVSALSSYYASAYSHQNSGSTPNTSTGTPNAAGTPNVAGVPNAAATSNAAGTPNVAGAPNVAATSNAKAVANDVSRFIIDYTSLTPADTVKASAAIERVLAKFSL